MSESDRGGVEQAAWRYVNSARPAQALIRETLTQIAGFALLLLTSRRPPSLAEAALLGAMEASTRATDAVRALEAPESAVHHHRHLREAAEALGRAGASALLCLKPEASEGERDGFLRALRLASDHLRLTAKLIPGFELVDLGQSCCAAHAPQRLLCEA